MLKNDLPHRNRNHGVKKKFMSSIFYPQDFDFDGVNHFTPSKHFQWGKIERTPTNI